MYIYTQTHIFIFPFSVCNFVQALAEKFLIMFSLDNVQIIWHSLKTHKSPTIAIKPPEKQWGNSNYYFRVLYVLIFKAENIV